jgi:hypothetical protein
MKRQRPEATAPPVSTASRVGPAVAAAHPVTISGAVLEKLEGWCLAPRRACESLRQAIRMYRRARGSDEESPTAKVVAALYLLLVAEDDPLTIQERLQLEHCLQPPVDASSQAA